MAFAQAAIEEHGEGYVIVMDSTQTVDDALEQFLASGYPDAATWVVVAQAGGHYGVIRLPNLQRILHQLGPEALTQPLSKLDIPPAGMVTPQDTTEYGTGELLDWVADNPGSTLVITGVEGFLGLIANPTMGSEGTMDESEKYPDWKDGCTFCNHKDYTSKSKTSNLCFCRKCKKDHRILADSGGA